MSGNSKERLTIATKQVKLLLDELINSRSMIKTGYILNAENTINFNNLFGYFFGGETDLDTHKCLFLKGTPGLGKTLTIDGLNMVARTMSKEQYCPISTSAVRLVESYRTDKSHYLNALMTKNIIVDELGDEPSEVSDFGTRLNIFENFIMERADKWQYSGYKTHYVTNLTAEELKRKYMKKIIDRFEQYETVIFKGESFRKSF
ncbi:MAG: hypothetical protein NT007_09870 [Candidatus Kapabacteria bacterium]|nr:hypothetical protein [Candidatus Kapabacteria bacterium]